MRCRIPIVYLVDSAGVNLPYQGGVFPGSVRRGANLLLQLDHAPLSERPADRGGDGAMHRRRRVSARALRRDPDGEGNFVHGTRRPQPGEGCDRPGVDSETLGGASTHTEISGVAHYAVDNDEACVAKIRDLIERLPISSRDCGVVRRGSRRTRWRRRGEQVAQHRSQRASRSPPASADALYDLLPADHRMSYDMHAVLRAILDNGEIDEFQESSRAR